MIKVVRYSEVADVVLQNLPVNAVAVGNGLVDALGNAICQAVADPLIKAIVISSEGKCFSAGANLMDFDNRDDTRDRIRWLTSDVMEDAQKPIVVAIQGQALGGRLELALAGHYRVCTPNAEFALPEAKLGLLPGGGGTQRLPRLVGAAFALEMMQSGKSVSAQIALEKGLVDLIVKDDLTTSSVAFARESIVWGPRPTRDRSILDNTEKQTRGGPRRGSTEVFPFIARCAKAARMEAELSAAVEQLATMDISASYIIADLRRDHVAETLIAEGNCIAARRGKDEAGNKTPS